MAHSVTTERCIRKFHAIGFQQPRQDDPGRREVRPLSDRPKRELAQFIRFQGGYFEPTKDIIFNVFLDAPESPLLALPIIIGSDYTQTSQGTVQSSFKILILPRRAKMPVGKMAKIPGDLSQIPMDKLSLLNIALTSRLKIL